MKKKKIIIIIIIALFILMLIPMPIKYKDGGSTEYKAILYQVTKYHILNPDSNRGYDDGWKIKILGITIYDKINSDVASEHVINIRSNDKKIKAITGSFCYKNGLCVDKINFEDVNYDSISSFYGNKLFIDNLDGNIRSIELFDYGSKDFTKTKVEYTNNYIITPSTSGLYIFKINAIYENKDIEYYFMSQISPINGDEIDIKLELKENTLTSEGLTMIIKNNSNKNIEYGNPFTIEKYDNSFWKTLEPINVMTFTLPAFILNINDSKELNINWKDGYGDLKGKYRIVKRFSYTENDNYISFNKYLEFEL